MKQAVLYCTVTKEQEEKKEEVFPKFWVKQAVLYCTVIAGTSPCTDEYIRAYIPELSACARHGNNPFAYNYRSVAPVVRSQEPLG